MPERQNNNTRKTGDGKNLNGIALFVSGSPRGVSANLLCELADQAEFVLAVDAGAEQLMAAGIVPDLLIGDFDSISQDTLHYLEEKGVSVQRYNPHKNYTDVELGLEALHSRGYSRVLATNILGGRTDHALSSLGALAGAVNSYDMEVALRDEHEVCYFISGKYGKRVLELDFEKGVVLSTASPLPPPPNPQHISLVAWGEPAVVSIQGTKWTLAHHVLSPYSALGVSNLLCSSTLRLTVHDSNGTILLLLSYCC